MTHHGRAQTTHANFYAVASLLLGLVPLFVVGTIGAIVFGLQANKQIDRSNGAETGKGMATTGVLLGLLQIPLTVLFLVTSHLPPFEGVRDRSPAPAAAAVLEGAATRAQDRTAQAALRNAVTAGKVLFTQSEDYTDATTVELAKTELTLSFVGGDESSPGPKVVSVTSLSPTAIRYAAKSQSGTCWFVQDVIAPDGQPVGGQPPGVTWNSTAGGSCSASGAPDKGWTRTPNT